MESDLLAHSRAADTSGSICFASQLGLIMNGFNRNTLVTNPSGLAEEFDSYLFIMCSNPGNHKEILFGLCFNGFQQLVRH